jgi:SNF2 family DNA or RNA helicase
MKTYGKVWLAEPEWLIEAEPHILLRLKRVFERIHKGSHGTVKLRNTIENARDLDWFIERYPMAISDGDRRALRRGAKKHQDHILLMEQMIDPNYTPRKFELPIPPRDYQARAAEITLAQGFLLLADELGLGKTFEAILTFTDGKTLPATVVAYPHLQLQWAAEIKKFAPALDVHVIKTSKPYELPKFMGRGPDVIVVTYTKLSGWAEVLAKYCNGVIFDEIQELRRNESQKYMAAKHVAADCKVRLGLTATPIFNYGGEVFNIVDVLKPGVLGARDEFGREWCHKADGDRLHDPKAFGTYLRENFIMLRRTRADVGRELPPVVRIPHRIDADAKALDEVKDSAAELAKIIMAQTAESFKGERLNASEQLSNLLRQATGIAKAPYVAEFVNLLLESGEPVILAGWHRAVYEIWRSKLEKAGRKIAWYTGSESPVAKEAAKKAFVDGEADAMFLSLRSGAGLDGLQSRCKTVVFGELDWSPAVHEQLIGRLHRDGQDDNVMAYFLVSDEGADPVISEVLGLKREQLEGIRNPHQDIIEKLETGGDHAKKLAAHYLSNHKHLAAGSAGEELAAASQVG